MDILGYILSKTMPPLVDMMGVNGAMIVLLAIVVISSIAFAAIRVIAYRKMYQSNQSTEQPAIAEKSKKEKKAEMLNLKIMFSALGAGILGVILLFAVSGFVGVLVILAAAVISGYGIYRVKKDKINPLFMLLHIAVGGLFLFILLVGLLNTLQ